VRVVAVQSIAAGTVSWTCERNTRLRQISSSVNNLYVSFNPGLVAADVTAPAAIGSRHDLLGPVINSSGSVAGGLDLQIPLEKGEVLWFVFAGAGTAFLYVDP
jgi:hypothetical protein